MANLAINGGTPLRESDWPYGPYLATAKSEP